MEDNKLTYEKPILIVFEGSRNYIVKGESGNVNPDIPELPDEP